MRIGASSTEPQDRLSGPLRGLRGDNGAWAFEGASIYFKGRPRAPSEPPRSIFRPGFPSPFLQLNAPLEAPLTRPAACPERERRHMP